MTENTVPQWLRGDCALELLDALHAEMEQGNGVCPFDIYDRIGVIIAVLRDGYNPTEGTET